MRGAIVHPGPAAAVARDAVLGACVLQRQLVESSRVMLKLPKRLLQVERLCSLCGLGKMII